jgi:cell division protein FtsW (lipid II flippase)
MRFASTLLFSCVVALLALGMVMLFSASTGQPEARYLILQPVWCGIGLVACWSIAVVGDYRWLKRLWWVLLVLAVGC